MRALGEQRLEMRLSPKLDHRARALGVVPIGARHGVGRKASAGGNDQDVDWRRLPKRGLRHGLDQVCEGD